MPNCKTAVPYRGTPEQEERLRKVIEEHKGQPGATMPVLQAAQEIFGYLPEEVQIMVAEGLDIPLSEVYGVSTFYSFFTLNPKGKYQISVCLGTACYVKGAADVLDAVEKKSAAVALEWEYADFLEQQRLARIDRTLSYCYVSLEEEESADPVGWLSGLTLQQKCELWRMFLGKRLFLPEFEWLRDAMLQGAVPNWIEWHLALYRVLEEENIRFFCKDGQFELLDKEGHRIYFGVDHSEAAEQVLMKVLFPLNQ